mmetsp:Transcript_14025/g.34030  ORF Transcript_14025/g.34030 Transcript_14025/m.34030 type:complete len:292 (+) Transcript_14025:572-1447(+)
MFRNGVSLYLDDFPSGDLVARSVADGLLVLLDGGAVDNGSSSNTDVVVLGEHPSVEIGRHVVTNIHLRHFFVKLHFVIRNLDTLLEGNGKIVLSGIHSLCYTRVGTVSADNKVNFHVLGCSGTGSFLVGLVVDGVLVLRYLVVGRDVDAGDQAIDNFGTVVDGAVAEVSVKDFTTSHTNVLIRFQGLTNINFNTLGGDKIHATDLTVNDALGKIKFADHTEGDGATAGLGIIELALKKNRIDSLFLGKDLGSAGTGRSSPDDGNLVLHVQGRLGDWNGGEVLSDKGRSREC